MANTIDTKKIAKRVSSCKFQGDDHYSWAVFIDGFPFVTGLEKREVPYYKQKATDRLIKGANHGC